MAPSGKEGDHRFRANECSFIAESLSTKARNLCQANSGQIDKEGALNSLSLPSSPTTAGNNLIY
jgi:hypothetical protein